jgi:hypothetical protein
VIWDNRYTLHMRGDLDPAQDRLMHRTQIQDEAAPCRCLTKCKSRNDQNPMILAALATNAFYSSWPVELNDPASFPCRYL